MVTMVTTWLINHAPIKNKKQEPKTKKKKEIKHSGVPVD